MTRTIPAELKLPGLAKIAHPRDIDGEDYEAIAQAGHHLYAREGCRAYLLPTTGRELTAPEHVTTTSTTLTQPALLQRSQGLVRCSRVLDETGTYTSRWRVRAFMDLGARARLSWQAADDAGTNGSLSLTGSGAPGWVEGTLLVVGPDELDGGGSLRLMRLWATLRSATGAEVALYHLSIEDDQELTDADLPSE